MHSHSQNLIVMMKYAPLSTKANSIVSVDHDEDIISRNIEPDGSVNSYDNVEHTQSYRLTIALVIHLAQLHIILMAISLPVLICMPDGCTFAHGNIRMISDGFKANSAVSTALWGAGLAWVTAVRYLGASTRKISHATIANICIPLATYSAFLTLRYDTFEAFHVVFAVVWITASFLMHFCVTLTGVGDRTLLARYVFYLGAIIGIAFITLFVSLEIGTNDIVDNIKVTAQVGDVQLLSAIAMLEVLTVLSLMFMDFILCGIVLDTFTGGVNIFVLTSTIKSKVFRVPLEVTMLLGYVFLLLVGVFIVMRIM